LPTHFNTCSDSLSRISENFNLHARLRHVVVTATDGVFVIGGERNTAGKV